MELTRDKIREAFDAMRTILQDLIIENEDIKGTPRIFGSDADYSVLVVAYGVYSAAYAWLYVDNDYAFDWFSYQFGEWVKENGESLHKSSIKEITNTYIERKFIPMFSELQRGGVEVKVVLFRKE